MDECKPLLRGAEKYGACAWKSDQVFSKQEEVVIKGVSVVSGGARADMARHVRFHLIHETRVQNVWDDVASKVCLATYDSI